MSKLRKRFSLAPEEIIIRTMEATTNHAIQVKCENQTIPTRHYISRFPFLHEKRLNDQFHTTLFPTQKLIEGHTCGQIFCGKETDHMEVYPLKTESHNLLALQDFCW